MAGTRHWSEDCQISSEYDGIVLKHIKEPESK